MRHITTAALLVPFALSFSACSGDSGGEGTGGASMGGSGAGRAQSGGSSSTGGSSVGGTGGGDESGTLTGEEISEILAGYASSISLHWYRSIGSDVIGKQQEPEEAPACDSGTATHTFDAGVPLDLTPSTYEITYDACELTSSAAPTATGNLDMVAAESATQAGVISGTQSLSSDKSWGQEVYGDESCTVQGKWTLSSEQLQEYTVEVTVTCGSNSGTADDVF